MTDVITKVAIGWVEYPFAGWGSGWQEVVYLTQAEYDALPASKLTDGKIYKIKTTGIPWEVLTAGAGIDITNNEISADMSTAVYDNTTSGATATNVQDAIDEVFQSVSNGKTLIAAAITDKGIQTAATDSFQTMASNISSLDIATAEQIAAYNMMHTGNGSLLTSINNNAWDTFVLKQLWWLWDIEMYEIWTEHNFSSSQKIYNYQIFALNKNWTYISTTANYSSSSYEVWPNYIWSDNTISYNFNWSKWSDSSHPESTDPIYTVYKDTLTYTPLIWFNLQTWQTITTWLPEAVKIDRFNGTWDYSSRVREIPRVEWRTLTAVQHITLPYTVTDSVSWTVHNIIIKV